MMKQGAPTMASNMNRRKGNQMSGQRRPQVPRNAAAVFSQYDDDDPFSDIPSSSSPRKSASRGGSSMQRRTSSSSKTHRPPSSGGRQVPRSAGTARSPRSSSSRLPSDLQNMNIDGSVASFRATDMPNRPAKRHNTGMRVQRGQLVDMTDETEDEATGIKGWFGHDPEHTMLMLSGGSYKGNSLWDWVRLIVLWMNYHKLVIVLVSALFVLIGFLFNKYIAVGWAFVSVVLGVILTQMGDEYDEMAFYFAGIISFIVPFLW